MVGVRVAANNKKEKSFFSEEKKQKTFILRSFTIRSSHRRRMCRPLATLLFLPSSKGSLMCP
jgi:hypothetical protein